MRVSVILLILAVGLAAPAFAEDPPARVGAVTIASGEVQYALDPETGDRTRLDWSPVDLNNPVSQNMSLATGPLGQATIQIGPDTMKMTADTVLDVLNLTDRSIEAVVRTGAVYLYLHDAGNGESAEFEMPNGSFWLLQNGGYNISSGQKDQPSRLMVLSGEARAIGSDDEADVTTGREALLSGTFPVKVTTGPIAAPSQTAGIAQSEQTVAPAATAGTAAASVPPPAAEPPAPTAPTAPTAPNPPAGGLPASAPSAAPAAPAATNSAAAPPSSPANSPPEMTGYDELAPYGTWESLPKFGRVWFPNPDALPVDWAPYRYGHWASVAPWGWTWVDDQPWGFTPFHYGRWAQIDNRWGWTPGANTADPVYAPALVAFVATPDNPAAIGWVPLAPGEAYVPWFAADPAFVQSLNQDAGDDADAGDGDGGGASFVNVTAVTVVTRDAFARGDPAGRNRLELRRDELTHLAVMRGARLAAIRAPASRAMSGGVLGPRAAPERGGAPGRAERGGAPGRAERGGAPGRAERGGAPGRAERGGAPGRADRGGAMRGVGARHGEAGELRGEPGQRRIAPGYGPRGGAPAYGGRPGLRPAGVPGQNLYRAPMQNFRAPMGRPMAPAFHAPAAAAHFGGGGGRRK